MTDLALDPGVGDPAGIRSLADDRDDEVDDLDLVVRRVFAAAGAVLPPLWQGAAQVAFAAAVERALADARTLRTGLAEHADALRAYAAAVETIQDEQERLQRRREALEAEKEAALRDEGIGLEARPGQGLPFGVLVPASADRVRAAEMEELAVQRLWDDLVEDRRRADRTCISALGSTASLGALALLTRGGGAACPTPTQMLAYLSDLSESDLVLLRERHPELLAALAEIDPQAIHDWWATLDGDDPWVLSPAQAVLVAGLPRLLGSLDGLPPHARVAANARNAEARLRELDRQALSPGADQAALERERQYLLKAVGPDATVQLYLYEPEAGNIIEMFGTFSSQTRQVITYVPGTYTSMESFYDGSHGTQGMAEWMSTSLPGGAVVFAFKDGVFPGERSPGAQGILEANDEVRTAVVSTRLVAFQRDLHTVTASLPDVQFDAVGHSWGLANVTTSEVLGSHYDHVVSLSGAGMPLVWRKQEGTQYNDLSYHDFLQEAQGTGAVWFGRNPRHPFGFEHGDYYVSDQDETLKGLHNPLDEFGVLEYNHSLVADPRSPANKAVRDDLVEILSAHE